MRPLSHRSSRCATLTDIPLPHRGDSGSPALCWIALRRTSSVTSRVACAAVPVLSAHCRLRLTACPCAGRPPMKPHVVCLALLVIGAAVAQDVAAPEGVFTSLRPLMCPVLGSTTTHPLSCPTAAQAVVPAVAPLSTLVERVGAALAPSLHPRRLVWWGDDSDGYGGRTIL
jgi:hypothetical protein